MSIGLYNNPILSFYIILCENNSIDLINKYAQKSWDTNPQKTIAIIFNNRDKYNGKGEKNSGIKGILWLRKTYNLFYRLNIKNYIDNYGCWKDIYKIIDQSNDDNTYEYKLIANQLIQDKWNLENNKEISLCAKWAPNQNDKKAILITYQLFDKNNKNLMELYRKKYLSPLRNNLNLIETKMCNNKWNEIDYNLISKKTLERYKNAFMKHDYKRYHNHNHNNNNNNTEDICNLVKYYFNNNELNEDIENQWKDLMIKIKFDNKITNMISVIDLSVINIAIITLGLLISNCCNNLFKNNIILFSKDPSLIQLKSNTLFDQVNHIKKLIDINNNINIEKTYNIILNKIINNNENIIPSNLLFLSNSNYNNISNNIDDIQDIFDNINSKFNINNYSTPKLIYWNLNNNIKKPYTDYTKDTRIINGYCKYSVNTFIKYQEITQEKILDEILESYYKNITL